MLKNAKVHFSPSWPDSNMVCFILPARPALAIISPLLPYISCSSSKTQCSRKSHKYPIVTLPSNGISVRKERISQLRIACYFLNNKTRDDCPPCQMFLFRRERTDPSLSMSSYHFLIDIVCFKEVADHLLLCHASLLKLHPVSIASFLLGNFLQSELCSSL